MVPARQSTPTGCPGTHAGWEVRPATTADVDGWRGLARLVEALFGAPMADAPEWNAYLHRHIADGTAWCAADPAGAVVGGIWCSARWRACAPRLAGGARGGTRSWRRAGADRDGDRHAVAARAGRHVRCRSSGRCGCRARVPLVPPGRLRVRVGRARRTGRHTVRQPLVRPVILRDDGFALRPPACDGRSRAQGGRRRRAAARSSSSPDRHRSSASSPRSKRGRCRGRPAMRSATRHPGTTQPAR